MLSGTMKQYQIRREAIEMDQKKTGSFIASLRKKKGLTQQELADRLSISNKTVSKWECGVSQS